MAQSSRHKPRHHGTHRPLAPRGPWANGPIPVVGLVGGIGAGKSLAASALGEAGLQVLDADAVGHALLAQRPCRDPVVGRFGTAILAPSDEGREPEVDRRALARVVFADPNARRDLEAILHPAMRKTFERAIARAGRPGSGAAGVVLDAAILFEAGWNDLCDAVLFVDAPRDLRLARLSAARGWSDDDLAVRESAQLPLDTKRDRADIVLANDAGPDALVASVSSWWGAFAPRRPARNAGPGPRR